MEALSAIICDKNGQLNYTEDGHIAMAKMYYNLYNGCLKFKSDEMKKNNSNNSNKNLNGMDCNFYYEQFKIHSTEFVQKNNSEKSAN